MSRVKFLLANFPVLKLGLERCLAKGRIKAIKNFLSIEAQHTRRISHLEGYPYMLTVETGNCCQLRCPLCPVGQNKTGIPKGFLKLEDFKTVIDEMGKYLILVFLYNWGEPLLNEDIFEMANFARNNGICTVISTNLNRFDEEICRNLVTSGPDLLIVSLDGASQETVEKYQWGNNFSKVIDNVNSIIKAKKELGSKRPVLQWRFVVNKFNEHEIPKAKKIAGDLGIILELSTMECDMAREHFMNPKEQFESVKDWLPSNEKYSMYSYKSRRRKEIPKNDCSFLWRHSVTNWDGSVFPCCWIYDLKYSFGNAFKQGFREIWNNEKYRSARKLVGRGERDGPETICNICYQNQAMV